MPAKGNNQGRFLDLVNVYNQAKISESPSVYSKRETVCGTVLDKLIASMPSRRYLCIAGDFNIDLQ